MGSRTISILAIVAFLAVSGIVRADEIRLKDGSKINGTIVGYENDSFRVETPYGFALVRKDKVAEIIPNVPKPTTAADKDSDSADAPATKAKKEVAAISATPASTTPASVSAAPKPAAPAAPKPKLPDAEVPNSQAPKLQSTIAKSAASSPAAGASPLPSPIMAPKPLTKIEARVAVPNLKPDCPTARACDAPALLGSKLPNAGIAAAPAPPGPPPIMEIVQGNKYINYTYGFEIYKPPSWDLIAADRKALPNAVAALGTDDGTTLLIMGREATKNSLDVQSVATDKALADIYENYRQISTRRTTIAQMPAVERRSRGSADGHDWSVITITLVRGSDAFTLLGMTWADSDLIQVQENVLSKVVSSLAFSVQ